MALDGQEGSDSKTSRKSCRPTQRVREEASPKPIPRHVSRTASAQHSLFFLFLSFLVGQVGISLLSFLSADGTHAALLVLPCSTDGIWLLLSLPWLLPWDSLDSHHLSRGTWFSFGLLFSSTQAGHKEHAYGTAATAICADHCLFCASANHVWKALGRRAGEEKFATNPCLHFLMALIASDLRTNAAATTTTTSVKTTTTTTRPANTTTPHVTHFWPSFPPTSAMPLPSPAIMPEHNYLSHCAYFGLVLSTEVLPSTTS